MTNQKAETSTFKLTSDAGKEPGLMLTSEEVSHLVLCEALKRQGITTDPDAYLEKQQVEYRVWIHPKMGASVVILGAREKPQPKTEDR